MKRRGILALLDVDPSLVERYRVDLAKFFAAAIAQIFVAAQFGLLRRKRIAVDRCLRRAPEPRRHIPDPARPGAFIQQVIGCERREPEMLPPLGLFFSTMPIQDLREQPARLLFRRPFQTCRQARPA